jgi:hypothetical protein
MTQDPNKTAHPTCVKYKKEKSGKKIVIGRSIVDHFLIRDPSKAVTLTKHNKPSENIVVHPEISAGSDHRLVTMTLDTETQPPDWSWGRPPPNRNLPKKWTRETTEDYTQSIESLTDLEKAARNNLSKARVLVKNLKARAQLDPAQTTFLLNTSSTILSCTNNVLTSCSTSKNTSECTSPPYKGSSSGGKSNNPPTPQPRT